MRCKFALASSGATAIAIVCLVIMPDKQAVVSQYKQSDPAHLRFYVIRDGCLLVDAHQRTTVAGVYAAGDVVLSLDQISVAMGQAAIAATAIHNDLRERGHQAPALG